MALKTDIRGMVWRYPDAFVVGREQVRQYARAVKSLDPATHDPQVLIPDFQPALSERVSVLS